MAACHSRLRNHRGYLRHGHSQVSGQFIEGAAALGVNRAIAGKGLPAPHDYVGVERIDFEPVAAAAGTLGGDYRGAVADEGIQ